jgi:hypothetical protein
VIRRREGLAKGGDGLFESRSHVNVQQIAQVSAGNSKPRR